MVKLIVVGFLFYCLTGTPVQTVTDKQTVIQMAIDLEDLQQYFHVDKIEGRIPLIIFNNGVVPSDLELKKFEQPVLFMEKKDLFFHKKDAYLNFIKFEITTKTAKVLFEYAVEGLTIEMDFEKNDGTWVITNKKLTEK